MCDWQLIVVHVCTPDAVRAANSTKHGVDVAKDKRYPGIHALILPISIMARLGRDADDAMHCYGVPGTVWTM